ncbi:MAG: replication-associated recombination protein A [Desulfovibrionaceae bacterium]|nr:replication-associated recombination protein A [Desulfovibrionaceae bacterium]
MSTTPPLAEQLRPKKLADFLGQRNLKTKINSLLSAKDLPSLLFFGPPGCGKSTLALLLAANTQKRYLRLSAPETGLQNLRRTLNGVEILILDEIHRFTKAQQDFFLPLIESGELTLLATTTENPSFSVTRQLLSRLHVLRLDPLLQTDLYQLAKLGAEKCQKSFPDECLRALAVYANGDGRTLLNLVEYASKIDGEITTDKIRALLPEVMVRHDKMGDSHYEYISALIKSIRGSDVNAAIYYLACLVEGGEDPRFICRRLILSASEDVGLADPKALPLAVACQQAVEMIGMPEGFIPMAETCVYLALAKKSNTAYTAFLRAKEEIRQHGKRPVPLHLRNATTALQKEWGYGKDYLYPHNFPEAWVAQDYLPPEVKDGNFYQPKINGEEPKLCQWWRKLHNIPDPLLR